MRIPREKTMERAGRHHIVAWGRQIPIIDLAGEVGDNHFRRGGATALLMLVHLGDRLAAFEVDGFHDIVTVVPGNPGTQIATIRGVAGVAALADSSMVVMLDPDAFINRGVLEHDGLTVFPLDGYAGALTAWDDEADPLQFSAAEKNRRVVVLETAPGPLVIPATRVAGIVGAGARQPSDSKHPWVCGDFHWRGYRVPVIDSAVAFGGGGDAGGKKYQTWKYAAILWPMKDGDPHGFFALTGIGPPGVVAIEAGSAAVPSDRQGRLRNVLGYVIFDRRTGMVPDLNGLAREIFHNG